MSADNWRVCPNCLNEYRKYLFEETTKLEKQYGKLKPADYVKQMNIIANKTERLDKGYTNGLRTMREDGLSNYIDTNGEYHVRYRASCQSCPLQFEYEITEKLSLPAKSRHDWSEFNIDEDPRCY